jgi:hypothetical protein
MSAIDRNRGCIIRFHPSGFRVVMYVDAPGEYFSESGNPMSEKLAGEAGFEVKELEHQRRKNARLAQYKAQVEEEFATQQEEVEAVLSAEAGTLQVKHIGGGKYAILDESGTRLTTKPLSKAEAETLIADFKIAEGGSYHGASS